MRGGISLGRSVMLLLGALMGARAFVTAPSSALWPRLGSLTSHELRAAGRHCRSSRIVRLLPSGLHLLQRSLTSGPPSYHRSRTPLPEHLTMAAVVESADGEGKIIDGKAIAETIRKELAVEVAQLTTTMGQTPGLAVVLVGDRADSATYVRMKIKACEEVGIASFQSTYPANVTEETLIQRVQELNADPQVHGILVQLPLPSHVDEQKVLDLIHPDKDVDGLHPLNLAKLAHTYTHADPEVRKFNVKELPFHAACTPEGCIELIERSGVSIEGKEAVVMGRSNIVGIPVALLLMQKNATVTILHSGTRDPKTVVSRADIVVAAVGRPEMVKGDWLKPGAVVIDVGINPVDDPTSKRGYRLVGDCDFESCRAVAGKITPVPGGVGPMTIAMLLRNTLNGAARQIKKQQHKAAR